MQTSSGEGANEHCDGNHAPMSDHGEGSNAAGSSKKDADGTEAAAFAAGDSGDNTYPGEYLCVFKFMRSDAERRQPYVLGWAKCTPAALPGMRRRATVRKSVAARIVYTVNSVITGHNGDSLDKLVD